MGEKLPAHLDKYLTDNKISLSLFNRILTCEVRR